MAKRKQTQAIKTNQVEFPPAVVLNEQELESGFSTSNRKVTVRRDGGKVIVSVPVRFYRRNGRQMILADGDSSVSNQQPIPETYTALATNLAKAWRWQEQLESGEFGSVDEIAKANKVDRTHVSRILQLTSLSPSIVERILAGNEPEGLSLRQLRKGVALVWNDQHNSR